MVGEGVGEVGDLDARRVGHDGWVGGWVVFGRLKWEKGGLRGGENCAVSEWWLYTKGVDHDAFGEDSGSSKGGHGANIQVNQWRGRGSGQLRTLKNHPCYICNLLCRLIWTWLYLVREMAFQLETFAAL